MTSEDEENTEFDRRLTERQRTLIAGAMRLLDQKGLDGFTMRSLASEIGLSPMAAYKHFENQRELQIELWRACAQEFYNLLVDRVVRRHTDPAVAMLELARAFIEYSVANPHRYELLFNHPFIGEVRKDGNTAAERDRAFAFALEYVQRAQDLGLFRNDLTAEQLLLSSMATVLGACQLLVMERLDEMSTMGRDAMVETVLTFVREGLMAR